MGQAKNRGSFEERRAAALEAEAKKHGLVKWQIADVLKELGLPPDTVFCGYVVHIPERDEFLASFRSDAVMSSRAWAKLPEHAHIFESYGSAHKWVEKDGEIVVGLFETPSQFVVASVK